MQGMTTPADELATLRSRAYGPRADIDDDPAALARLRELEGMQRRGRTVTHDAPQTVPAPAAVGSAAPAPHADTDAFDTEEEPGADRDAGADGSASDAPHPPRPIARGWMIAWAASILVVAVTVGAVVFGLASIRPVDPSSGAAQVDTLTPSEATLDGMEWIKRWYGTDESVRGWIYDGLAVVRTPMGMFGAGSDCLTVVPVDAYSSADESISGPIFSGCAAGSFPATVEFVIDAEMPEELRERFGEGTALSFVLRGDAVGVFHDDLPAVTPTPTLRPLAP